MSELAELFERAQRLDATSRSWLLETSSLSAKIASHLSRNDAERTVLREAVRAAANEAGCDLVVAASRDADALVDAIAVQTYEPSRALIIDLVCVTGVTMAQTCRELRHLDVVTAALLDLRPDSVRRDQPILEIGARQLVGS